MATIWRSPPDMVPTSCLRRSPSRGKRRSSSSTREASLGARPAHGAELEVLHHGHVLEDVLALGHIAEAQPHDLVRAAGR